MLKLLFDQDWQRDLLDHQILLLLEYHLLTLQFGVQVYQCGLSS